LWASVTLIDSSRSGRIVGSWLGSDMVEGIDKINYNKLISPQA
jgi:hypothetical protein